VARPAYPQAGPSIGGLAVSDGRLAGDFASVFALILHLRTLPDFGNNPGLRTHAEALLDQAVAAARGRGANPADIREAEFCLVAFFDETVLGSEWPGREAWAANPLQLSRYERYDAGEAFFERLRELFATNGREEVMEVYYLCLSLGYKGRYQIHGREVLRQLIDELQSRLGRLPGGQPGVLAPRAIPRGPAAVAEAGGIPTWALFVGAALLVVLLYIGLSFSVSGIAGEVSSDIRALPVSAE
jgi:type VI secretion system protein ImpK